jgi:hypothetical protein
MAFIASTAATYLAPAVLAAFLLAIPLIFIIKPVLFSSQTKPSSSWEPLPDSKQWIRILSLECGETDDQLIGSLTSADIHSGVQYEATSYSVGKTEKSHQILIRKGDQLRPLAITASLFHMLRRLRSKTGTRRLWIDAISIDQTNASERGDQIMIMHKIYTKTQRVLIYLGEPEDTTFAAVDLMARIYQAVHNSPPELDSRPLMWLRHHNLPDPREPWGWEPLKDFFCREWFHRKWTIQECILPPRTTFHCGNWEADWNFMNKLVTAIYNQGLAVIDHTTYSKVECRDRLQQGLAQFHAVAEIRNAYRSGHTFQLMEVVHRFQISRATDLRDHLFALLGLANDVNSRATGRLNYLIALLGLANDGDYAALRPAYGAATILDNCLRYAWFFLKQKGNLEVLYRAGLQGHKLLAPSWVPNWYGKQTGFGFEYAQGPWNPLQRPHFYNIARGTAVQINRTKDPRILRLRGVVVDQVLQLANKHLDVPPGKIIDKDFLLSQKRQHLEQCDAIVFSSGSSPTVPGLQTALWKTLICGVTVNHQRAPEEPYAAAYLAWRLCLNNDFTSLEDMKLMQQRQQPFRQAYDAFNGDKIFGVTAAGHGGMFSKSTQVGDIVVAFFGGEFPFTLRPRNTQSSSSNAKTSYPYKFELVGQCYIHNLMEDGQFDITSPEHIPHWFDIGGEYEVEDPWQPTGTSGLPS